MNARVLRTKLHTGVKCMILCCIFRLPLIVMVHMSSPASGQRTELATSHVIFGPTTTRGKYQRGRIEKTKKTCLPWGPSTKGTKRAFVTSSWPVQHTFLPCKICFIWKHAGALVHCTPHTWCSVSPCRWEIAHFPGLIPLLNMFSSLLCRRLVSLCHVWSCYAILLSASYRIYNLVFVCFMSFLPINRNLTMKETKAGMQTSAEGHYTGKDMEIKN